MRRRRARLAIRRLAIRRLGIGLLGIGLLAIAPLLAPAAARAAAPGLPVLDVAAVPYVQEVGRASYQAFLLMNEPRAFAVGPHGGYGWQTGGTIETARAKALESCARKDDTACEIYAEDLQVVWHGRAPVALAVPPSPLVQTRDFALVPDARFIWHGPQAARGVFVWGHGVKSGFDYRGLQPQSHVRAFNNAGFDIVRFDRAPFADQYADDAADFLRGGLARLRRDGWRMVVVGGQSRGAWNSLQMLDTAGLADAVVAISPASFNGTHARQAADLHRILAAATGPSVRVVVVQFEGDVYVQDFAERAADLNGTLRGRVGSVLVIDRPPGLTGHGAGESGAFARGYGPCILRFVTAPVPPADCGVAPHN